MTDQTTLWTTFKELFEEPGQPRCPFCDMDHRPIYTHPYCDTATRFRLWCHTAAAISDPPR